MFVLALKKKFKKKGKLFCKLGQIGDQEAIVFSFVEFSARHFVGRHEEKCGN